MFLLFVHAALGASPPHGTAPTAPVPSNIRVVQSPPDRAPVLVSFAADKEYRDPIKLRVVRVTDTAQGGGAVLIQKYAEELCELPCTVELPPDWYEFSFAMGTTDWLHPLKVVDGGQDVTVRPPKPVLNFYGFWLTGLLVTAPVGIPMLIAGAPRLRSSPRSSGLGLDGEEAVQFRRVQGIAAPSP